MRWGIAVAVGEFREGSFIEASPERPKPHERPTKLLGLRV